jgi:hypothetical protein
MPDHPVVRAIRSLPSDLLGEILFRRFMKVAVHPRGRVLLRLAGTDDPILLEQQVGRGKSLLFTSSADRSWHTMVTSPAYPILLQQAVTYLTSQPEPPSVAGASLTAVLPDGEAGTEATFEDPTGRLSHVRAVARRGQAIAVLPAAGRAGFYEVRHGVEQQPTTLAVNPDTIESDVRVLERSEFRDVARRLSCRAVPAGDNLAVVVREARVGREFHRMLMLAAMVVLLVESLLSRRFSQSGRSTP